MVTDDRTECLQGITATLCNPKSSLLASQFWVYSSERVGEWNLQKGAPGFLSSTLKSLKTK